METLVSAATSHHVRISVPTRRAIEFIDLTDRIEALAAGSGVHTGLVNIQSLHATTAIGVDQQEPRLLSELDALRVSPSALLNFAEGRLQLADGQRVFLVELDGPRVREVSVLVVGEGAR